MRTLLLGCSIIIVCQSGCQKQAESSLQENNTPPASSLERQGTASASDPLGKTEEQAPSIKTVDQSAKSASSEPSTHKLIGLEPDGKEAKADEAKATEATTDEAARPPLPELPELTDQQTQRVCMRACNKTHQCDFVREGVALCVTRCVAAQKAGDNRTLYQEARLFRAQGGCADKLCARFQTCVVKSLMGQEALALEPAMSRDKTEAFCKPLCAKQKTCEPAYFSNLPGGMVSCIANCQQTAIRPSAAAASQRVIMRAAFDCIDKDCGKPFEDCARENLTIPKTTGRTVNKL